MAKKEFPHGYFDGGGEGPRAQYLDFEDRNGTRWHAIVPSPEDFIVMNVNWPWFFAVGDIIAADEIETGNAADGDRWREPVGFGVGICPECRGWGAKEPTEYKPDIFICDYCHGTGRVAVKEE